MLSQPAVRGLVRGDLNEHAFTEPVLLQPIRRGGHDRVLGCWEQGGSPPEENVHVQPGHPGDTHFEGSLLLRKFTVISGGDMSNSRQGLHPVCETLDIRC